MRYSVLMHIAKLFVGLSLAVVAVGCGGGGANAPNDVVTTDCDAVASKLKAFENSMKGSQGPVALGPALERLSADLQAEPIQSADVREAAAALSSAATTLASKLKELDGSVKEVDKVSRELLAWQERFEKKAGEYDAACAKGSQAECDQINVALQKVPQFDGAHHDAYADELEAFIKSQDKLTASDPGVKAALSAMLSTLGEAVPLMRRMAVLVKETAPLDPLADDIRAKSNKVREVCGLPVKK